MADIVLCSVEDCGKSVKSGRKGFCGGHYKRFYKYGDPKGGSRGPRAENGDPLKWLYEKQFFSDKDKCLKWPYGYRGAGYGAVINESGELIGAHVKMCEIVNGPIPHGKNVAAHSCGKGHEGCVNPHHLRWASNSENMLDRHIHGTDMKGEKSPLSKLSRTQIDEIRALKGKMSQTEIAKIYKIGQPHVSDILLYRVWN